MKKRKEVKQVKGNQRPIVNNTTSLFGTPIKSVQTISAGSPYIDTGRKQSALNDIKTLRSTDAIHTSINTSPLHVACGLHYVNVGGCK